MKNRAKNKECYLSECGKEDKELNFIELNQYKYLFLDTIKSTNENALIIT